MLLHQTRLSGFFKNKYLSILPCDFPFVSGRHRRTKNIPTILQTANIRKLMMWLNMPIFTKCTDLTVLKFAFDHLNLVYTNCCIPQTLKSKQGVKYRSSGRGRLDLLCYCSLF
jgi:hypothetical protein